MEAFAAVFKDIYTTFILRDFAGKIVPGIVLMLTMASLYVRPSRIIKFVSGELSTPLVLFAGGFAWTLVLGLQGLTNAFHIWRYYPETYNGKLLNEIDAQLVVQQFMQMACQADRQQYERLVVIKEATGNLFAVLCLCSLIGAVSLFFYRENHHRTKTNTCDIPTSLRSATVFLVFYVFLIGLKLMNSEHIYKQYDFAARFATAKHQGCPADERPEKKA